MCNEGGPRRELEGTPKCRNCDLALLLLTVNKTLHVPQAGIGWGDLERTVHLVDRKFGV